MLDKISPQNCQFYFAVPTNQSGGVQGRPAEKKGNNMVKRCVIKFSTHTLSRFVKKTDKYVGEMVHYTIL